MGALREIKAGAARPVSNASRGWRGLAAASCPKKQTSRDPGFLNGLQSGALYRSGVLWHQRGSSAKIPTVTQPSAGTELGAQSKFSEKGGKWDTFQRRKRKKERPYPPSPAVPPGSSGESEGRALR
ncbi:uncharacterized protein PS065_004761 [Dugong dugon]